MDPSLVSEIGLIQPPNDLSMWSLFLRADAVVKIAMTILVLGSIWSWAIIFDKWFRLRWLQRKTNKFEENFWSGQPLDKLYESLSRRTDHPMANMFVSAMREWERAHENTSGAGLRPDIQERIERVMSVTMSRDMAQLERQLPFLATVGSTAPFIGLFGTVWGIMNSFQSIAATQNTNLAVVAPGIAEALLATALGLLAAIPAVMAYNKFSNDLNRYATRLEGFAGEFSAILSRQLDGQD